MMRQDVPISKLGVPKLLLLFVLVLWIWIAYEIVRPFLDAILIAGMFAIIMYPLYHRLLDLLGGQKSLSAFICTLLLAILVTIPGWLLVSQLFSEGATILQELTQWIGSNAYQDFVKKPQVVRILTTINRYVAELQGLTGESATQNVQNVQILPQIALSFAQRALSSGSQFLGNTLSLVGNFFLMIFTFFFMIRDHKVLRQSVFWLFPFIREHEDIISEQIALITRSSLLGTFIVALAQGVGAGIGFWLTGMPVLFGSIASAFASFIPIVGTGLVWIPAIIYLLAVNKFWSAVFLFFWGTVVVGFLLDNFLRPIVIGRGLAFSTPLLFVFILGGINFFGLLGVLYGPMILSGLYILLYLYDFTIMNPASESNEDEENGKERV
jgi:predicted PurR-regulated permease PerM